MGERRFFAARSASCLPLKRNTTSVYTKSAPARSLIMAAKAPVELGEASRIHDVELHLQRPGSDLGFFDEHAAGLVGFLSTATRESFGIASLSSSNRLLTTKPGSRTHRDTSLRGRRLSASSPSLDALPVQKPVRLAFRVQANDEHHDSFRAAR